MLRERWFYIHDFILKCKQPDQSSYVDGGHGCVDYSGVDVYAGDSVVLLLIADCC